MRLDSGNLSRMTADLFVTLPIDGASELHWAIHWLGSETAMSRGQPQNRHVMEDPACPKLTRHSA
jgi:hypothetical protein